MQSPFDIEELFIEIVKLHKEYFERKTRNHLDNSNNGPVYSGSYLYNECKYLRNIVNFNRISKKHYTWLSNTSIFNYFNAIKHAVIWLKTDHLSLTFHNIYNYKQKCWKCGNEISFYNHQYHVLVCPPYNNICKLASPASSP